MSVEHRICVHVQHDVVHLNTELTRHGTSVYIIDISRQSLYNIYFGLYEMYYIERRTAVPIHAVPVYSAAFRVLTQRGTPGCDSPRLCKQTSSRRQGRVKGRKSTRVSIVIRGFLDRGST